MYRLILLLTISDTRTEETDTSGALLKGVSVRLGIIVLKKIIPDDIKIIKETIQTLSNKTEIDCIITTGGTGLTEETQHLKQ